MERLLLDLQSDPVFVQFSGLEVYLKRAETNHLCALGEYSHCGSPSGKTANSTALHDAASSKVS